MRVSSSVLILLLQVLACNVVLADASGEATDPSRYDWPQWRGANRDAVSSETGLIHEWPEGGPQVLWRTKVGVGYSGVAVSDGKLFTLWDEQGKQFLFGLDAKTGKELWRQDLGAGFTNHYGDGPRSTPLVHGDVVFAIGTAGRLLAADKSSGKPRWQHDLVKEYSAKLPTYGYSSSPLVVGDRLLVEAGGEHAAYIAFDAATGEVAWASEDERPAYSSPISISIDGVDQIVFWSANGLRSVSPGTGTVLWRHTWETFCPVSGDPLNTGTPIFIAPNRLFISSGSGASVIKIVQSGSRFSVRTVWKSPAMRNDVNSSVLLGNYVYGFDRGILECIDVRTGEVKWKARGFQKGSLIAADGQLIVLGEQGNLALVEANPDGFVQKDSATVLTGKSWTSPALAQGKLYLRNHEELICLNMK